MNLLHSPWHGACFDVCSGDIEDAPGLNSLQTFKVRHRSPRGTLGRKMVFSIGKLTCAVHSG